MKIGGLFSGVGGFELAWTQLGHEVAWMCEIDKNARKVLNERFPGVPVYEDVRDLDPAEVEAVNVLTGGSPCQGFSVAGARTGLEHSESQLFADYIRIMDGLAERGLQYAIWENVPGVLSIQNDDGERTFNHVVAALAGGTEPVRLPSEQRWNTGLASGRDRAVAWRVLDSRYFGVAQRRRRIFACVAFGDSAEDRAGRALLAVAKGVSRDPAKSEPPLQSSSSTVGAGADEQSVAGALKARHDGSFTGDGQAMEIVPDVVGALLARSYKGISSEELQAGQAIVQEFAPTVTSKWAKGTGGPSGSETGNLVLDNAQAFNWQSGGDARGLDLTDETSALTCQQTPAVFGMLAASGAEGASEEEQPAITSSHGQLGNVAVPEEMVDFGRTSDRIRINAESAATLQAGVVPIQDAREMDKGQNGLGIGEEGGPSYTLDTASAQAVGPVPVGSQEALAFRKAARAQSTEDAESWVDDGVANTLTPFDQGDIRTTHAVVQPSYGLWGHSGTEGAMEETSPAVTASHGQPKNVAMPLDEVVRQDGLAFDGWNQNLDVGVHRSLRTGRDASDFVADPGGMRYGVRRLTPVECERLQGFPDGWTEPTGSDSARYKAMGNAVTVNTVRWILGRILAVEEGHDG